MESKSISAYLFEENTNSGNVSNLITPPPHQPQVRVCVPVPMYHCFGSVLAGMSMAVHGVTLVFPSSGYNSQANLEAIQSEKYGALLATQLK